jgi:two-component system, NarL family, sensor histidine kinase DesK
MTAMWRRWNERGSLGWFEFRTRAGVYVLLAAVPVLAVVLGVQHQVRGPGLAVFLLLSVAQAGVCIALLHAGLGRYLAAGPQPDRWLVASAAALTAAGVLAGAAAFPAFTHPPGTAFPVSMQVAMLFSGALILALTPLLSLRALTALVVVSAAAASGLTASVGRAGPGAYGQFLFAASLVYAVGVGVGVLTCRSSASGLRIMSELDRSRAAHARLSVAEERLRFARDLHDVLGRNLSLIAVQSELAAELARRGDQDAAGHMLEVRQVAHESLREMRAVVGGYRTADLGTELAGAQEVLRSAGVSCRVTGDAAGLPPDVQAALGWVVREGTTNIIRHSDATACTIELHILDSPGAPRAVTLSMDNDRVHMLDAGSGGSGLLGLGERLAGLGGSITTGHPRNGHFRLEASLPACGAAAVPPGPGQRGTGVTAETPVP